MQFRALGRGTEVALARPREIDTLEQHVETTDITVQILRDIRDTMNVRFDAVDKRFDAVDKRFDAVDARFDKLESRVTGVEQRLGAVEGRLIGVESSVTSIHYDLVRIRPLGDGDALVKRVSRCERDIADLKQRLDDR
jgi:hypothetical protein